MEMKTLVNSPRSASIKIVNDDGIDDDDIYILNYGCESWTWNKPMRMKVNAFERWCYRMILGISWRDHVSTPKAMERVQIELQTELHFTRDMIKRKMEYAGHVLRGSSGLLHLQILEGKVEEKKKVGHPIRIWMDEI